MYILNFLTKKLIINNSLKSIDKINGYKIIENKNQSSSKSTVKSYWIVGTTLLINFKKTKRL